MIKRTRVNERKKEMKIIAIEEMKKKKKKKSKE